MRDTLPLRSLGALLDLLADTGWLEYLPESVDPAAAGVAYQESRRLLAALERKPQCCALCGLRGRLLWPLSLHPQEGGASYWAHRSCVLQAGERVPYEWIDEGERAGG